MGYNTVKLSKMCSVYPRFYEFLKIIVSETLIQLYSK